MTDVERMVMRMPIIYPGMNKVLQSAGRVIRTEEDCGVIILLDDRFLKPGYEKLYPREWNEIYPVTKHNFKNILAEFLEKFSAIKLNVLYNN